MPDDLLSIGAFARAAGLPVTALRYYDAAGVLRPAHVDPATGYRRYTAAQVHPARLVAQLRAAGLPVPELVAVLATPGDADAVLARHRARLEADLAAARTHLDAAARLLAAPARCVVDPADLAAALAAVRHAVGAHPAWPGLAGVLVHLDGATLRLVGCDGARLAVATVPVRDVTGPQARAVAPLALLDAATAGPPSPTAEGGAGPGEIRPGRMVLGEVVLGEVAPGEIVLGPRELTVLGHVGAPLDAPYPDHERLLATGGETTTTVDAGALVDTAAGAGDVVVVRLEDGRVHLAKPGPHDTFGYARSFLLDAVRAVRAERIALTVDDARGALSVSAPGRPEDVGLVMPVLLHH